MAAPVSQDEFAAWMRPLGPFGARPRLAAGVSGGPHSLALAWLAQAWAAERGGSLLALIVDHGLRAGSAEEARRVRDRLSDAGIAARVIAIRVAPGAGTQSRARAARMRALLDVCAQEARPWLLLGHHAEDQAETLLSRALAGSGPAGLASMATVRAEPQALMLRPLLGVAPARLEATIAAAALTPECDPSNADARFLRVRLRGVASPAAQPALSEAAARFGERRAARDGAIALRLATCAMVSRSGFVRVDRDALGSDAVAVAALATLLGLVAGAAFPSDVEAVAALLHRGQGTLDGAWLRAAQGGASMLTREPSGLEPPVPVRRGVVWDGRFRLVGEGAEGHWLGALGDDPMAQGTSLPLALRAAVPAIRDANGRLAALPTMDYPSPLACGPFALAFAPQGGAPLGWARSVVPGPA
ncbi:tRNA lysidine(34) synthetase TilS [Plastoroseomonas arctica]|uniref:tRNA(Ile)-lysidine synthase n=1 Tax=Plastoroseomonas arctica TaxID=1509237 RepID=A0AAF1JX26_9PROT|nr:tRNA lysidine(34) synthetase TilS [Plastoroseomonas arctica]MBR0655277.1 tRNA lysidine(34) synthetase TilS [Plastoroseomonas arctica]